MRRLIVATTLAAPAGLAAWICRTGYVMPVLYGIRQWVSAARPARPEHSELDRFA